MRQENRLSVKTDYNYTYNNENINKANIKSVSYIALLIGTSIALHKPHGLDMINYDNNIGIMSFHDVYNTSSFHLGEYNINERQKIEVVNLRKMDNLNKLEYLKHFEYDWNGNGGLPFSEASILSFINIINNVKMQPDIAPTGRGSLLMQYELDDRSYLGFEVYEEKVNRVYIPQRDYARAEEEEVSANILDYINNCVEKFYA